MRRTLFKIDTSHRGFYDLTAKVQKFVAGSGINDGFCQLFVQHTSASLILTENADPRVREDLEACFSRWISEEPDRYLHNAEGRDDMPAHIRSVMTEVSVLLPVAEARCMLGSWQGIYLWEHRRRGHERCVVVSVWEA